MYFALLDHQEQLLRAVGRWLDQSWHPGETGTTRGRRSLWAELVRNGWTAMLSSTALAPGAEPLPVLDAALLVERLALGGCTLAVGPGAMVAPFVAELAGLPPAGGIDQLLVLDDVGADGGSGAVPAARGLELADRLVVLRRSGDRWAAATVPLLEGSLEVVGDEGRTVLSRLGSVAGAAFTDIDPAAATLAWHIGAVLSAAELVGLAQAVLDDCVAYAKVRTQGGKPIGGHQAIQHRLADMLGAVERTRYLTYHAANGVPAGAAREVHQAKAIAGRDCLLVIRSGHQVMGAIGYSAEHQLHHFHKQGLVAAHEFGSAADHWSALEDLSSPR